MRGICICGGSASGKTHLAKALADFDKNKVITYTTRGIREGEVQDRDYHFVTGSVFNDLYESGKIAEVTTRYGNLYGTPSHLPDDFVCVVDMQGIDYYVNKYGKEVLVVYVDVDEETKLTRLRDREDSEIRLFEDYEAFREAKEKSDIIIRGDVSTDIAIKEVLASYSNQRRDSLCCN